MVLHLSCPQKTNPHPDNPRRGQNGFQRKLFHSKACIRWGHLDHRTEEIIREITIAILTPLWAPGIADNKHPAGIVIPHSHHRMATQELVIGPRVGDHTVRPGLANALENRNAKDHWLAISQGSTHGRNRGHLLPALRNAEFFGLRNLGIVGHFRDQLLKQGGVLLGI